MEEARVRNADGSSDRMFYRPTPVAGRDALITGIMPFAPR